MPGVRISVLSALRPGSRRVQQQLGLGQSVQSGGGRSVVGPSSSRRATTGALAAPNTVSCTRRARRKSATPRVMPWRRGGMSAEKYFGATVFVVSDSSAT